MQKSILFLGDSFTWGEGLELYCDTPKWIAERNKRNEWMELVEKQDDDGIRFREENRFAGLVAKHFNKTALVDEKNGGSIGRSLAIAEKFLLDPDLYIDLIIIQFSAFTREPLHMDYWCRCDMCMRTRYAPLYERLPEIIIDVMDRKKLSETDMYILRYFENKLNMPSSDPLFLKRFINDKHRWALNKIKELYNKHIITWGSDRKRKIYFLDSWEIDSSYILYSNDPSRKIPWLYDNKIPLIGKDGNKHFKWHEWENTFEFLRISNEFHNTHNPHPTLEQHKYLATSIIDFLEGIGYE